MFFLFRKGTVVTFLSFLSIAIAVNATESNEVIPNSLNKAPAQTNPVIIPSTPPSFASSPTQPKDNKINAPVSLETASDNFYRPYPPTPIAPPPQGELIKKGEYLAKMGDCIACHTNTKAGSLPYAGGLSINTPFGTFYTPNITPDKDTGIGTWTEQDFIRALKKGRDPSGRNYFPVFPYLYFAKMSDEDARALYAYFMSIPPVKQENKPLPFPFGIPGVRFTLWGWNLLFFFSENDAVAYVPHQSPTWNRGKYIVDSLGHCSMCHTPLNVFGAPKDPYYLTGAFIDGYWAPNITQYGLEGASIQEIMDVFTHNQLLHQAGPVAGPMADVNINSLSYLTDQDKLAIATYLKTVDTQDPRQITPSQNQSILGQGRNVYIAVCSMCHQEGNMSAPLIGDSSNWYMRYQREGLNTLVQHAIQGYNSMPYKGACVHCTDQDVRAAVDYILDKSLSHSQRESLSKNRK